MYAFSDGSPFVELLIFCATFAACLTLVQWKPAASAVDRVLGRTAVFLRKRIFLVDDVDTEQRRLDLIRIAFGLVTLFRNAGNLATALELGDPVVVGATAAASLLSGLLMLGVMVPLSAGLLGILINTVFDPIADTRTLASIVMSMVCIAFAMAPAGRSLSVDALILRGDTGWGRVWRRVYRLVGPLTLDRAAIVKGALMLSYGGISLSSGLLHLQAENWRQGMTNAWVFINPVMTPEWHTSVGKLYEWSPFVYVWLTKATVYGTLVFQLGLVPLLLISRWTQRLAVCLELGFVAGSVTLLALHWLGWFQLAMCCILFWNRFTLNVGQTATVQVLYDDRCNLCDRTRRFLAAVDLFAIVEFRPLSKNFSLAEQNGISQTQALTDLYGIDRSGRCYKGYDLYTLLAGRIFLLLPLWPILAIGRIAGVGPRVYRYVASRRTELFGVCSVDMLNPAERAGTGTERSSAGLTTQFPALIRGFALTFLIMFGAFAARLPVERYVPWFAEAASASKRTFGMAPIALGLMQVDAFNFPPLRNQLFNFQVSWSRDGQQRYLFSIPASRADIRVSDMLFYQVQTSFNSFLLDGLCFGPGFASDFVNRLAVKAVLTRPEFVGGEFHLRLAVYDIPGVEDFRAYRYVPLRYYDVCEASFPADDLKAQRFRYFQEGLDRIGAWSAVLPFRVSAAGIPLVVNYPCRAEAQRIAYWFDRPRLAGRDPGTEERVRQLMVASQTKFGLACLLDALPVVSMIHTNWREGHPPPSGASCEHDLASGRAMLASGLDAIVHDARETVGLAEAADARGDQRTCLLQMAAIRRAFYASLRSPSASDGGGTQ